MNINKNRRNRQLTNRGMIAASFKMNEDLAVSMGYFMVTGGKHTNTKPKVDKKKLRKIKKMQRQMRKS